MVAQVVAAAWGEFVTVRLAALKGVGVHCGGRHNPRIAIVAEVEIGQGKYVPSL